MTRTESLDLRTRLNRFLQSVSATHQPRLTFQRFQLPDQLTVKEKNREFRRSMVDRFYNGAVPDQRLSFTPDELKVKLGDLEQVADPSSALREFHQQHSLRIVDLLKANRDAAQAAEQISGLRQVLATWAFRLAAMEQKAEVALAVGGERGQRRAYFPDRL